MWLCVCRKAVCHQQSGVWGQRNHSGRGRHLHVRRGEERGGRSTTARGICRWSAGRLVKRTFWMPGVCFSLAIFFLTVKCLEEVCHLLPVLAPVFQQPTIQNCRILGYGHGHQGNWESRSKARIRDVGFITANSAWHALAIFAVCIFQLVSVCNRTKTVIVKLRDQNRFTVVSLITSMHTNRTVDCFFYNTLQPYKKTQLHLKTTTNYLCVQLFVMLLL